MAKSTELVPVPGTDLVPDGWCESTVMPWADNQSGTDNLAQASAQIVGMIAAYKTLSADTLELVKARRYLELRWGELLGPAKPGPPSGESSSNNEDSPLTPNQRHEFRKLAENKDKIVAALAEATDEKELSRGALLSAGAHVGHNSGDNEWYTPTEYIKAAVAVMGAIDLDPASTAEANKIVGASKFFGESDDSLRRKWKGRVWMNPPYAFPLVGDFCSRLAESYAEGDVTEACVLTNNGTDTFWFHTLAEVGAAICFPRGRIKFWHPGKDSASPLQGQAITYLGENIDAFRTEFVGFGFTVTL